MDLCIIDINNKDGKKRIIDNIQQYIQKENPLALKKISTELITSKCLTKSKDILYLSYLPYIFSKMLTQPHIIKDPNWFVTKSKLINSLDYFESKSISEYKILVLQYQGLFKNNPKIYNFIRHNLELAKVRQASKLVESGYTENEAVKITDADLIELKQYMHHNSLPKAINLKENISVKVDILENYFIKSPNKIIVFDSGVLISLGNSGLFDKLILLKDMLKLRFVIAESVKDEVIAAGERVGMFAWHAAQTAHLIDDGVIEVVGLDKNDLIEYKKIDKDVNRIYKTKNLDMEILQKGEIESIILMKKMGAKILAIDELTTRLLFEDHKHLKELLESRYKTNISVDDDLINRYKFNDIKIIRSVDLMAFAYHKGFFAEYQQNVLKSILYALKYSGCAVTFEEIDGYIKEVLK